MWIGGSLYCGLYVPGKFGKESSLEQKFRKVENLFVYIDNST